MKKPVLMFCSVLAALLVAAQTAPQTQSPESKQTSQTANTPAQTAPAENKATAVEGAKPAENATASAKPKAAVAAAKIPSGAKVYVAPMGGFENYVIAGILKKKVPVLLVGDRDKAEYEIRGSAETEKAGWAKMLFLGSQQSNEQASVNVQEIKTGNLVFAYSVNKTNSARGKQSAGEAIGKHLNEAIGKD
jgi:hypothetical protein